MDRNEIPRFLEFFDKEPVQGAGRPRRFAEIVLPCLPRLHGMARRLAGQDAEDLVQEALLHAYRHFDQLHDWDAASAWLATIPGQRLSEPGAGGQAAGGRGRQCQSLLLYQHLATPSARPALAPAKPCSTWAAGAASIPSWPPAGSAGDVPIAAVEFLCGPAIRIVARVGWKTGTLPSTTRAIVIRCWERGRRVAIGVARRLQEARIGRCQGCQRGGPCGGQTLDRWRLPSRSR